jgi:hypothetical protein
LIRPEPRAPRDGESRGIVGLDLDEEPASPLSRRQLDQSLEEYPAPAEATLIRVDDEGEACRSCRVMVDRADADGVVRGSRNPMPAPAGRVGLEVLRRREHAAKAVAHLLVARKRLLELAKVAVEVQRPERQDDRSVHSAASDRAGAKRLALTAATISGRRK